MILTIAVGVAGTFSIVGSRDNRTAGLAQLSVRVVEEASRAIHLRIFLDIVNALVGDRAISGAGNMGGIGSRNQPNFIRVNVREWNLILGVEGSKAVWRCRAREPHNMSTTANEVLPKFIARGNLVWALEICVVWIGSGHRGIVAVVAGGY